MACQNETTDEEKDRVAGSNNINNNNNNNNTQQRTTDITQRLFMDCHDNNTDPMSSSIDGCLNTVEPFSNTGAAVATGAPTTAEPNSSSGKVYGKPLRSYSPSSLSHHSPLSSSIHSYHYEITSNDIYGGLAKIGDDSNRSSDQGMCVWFCFSLQCYFVNEFHFILKLTCLFLHSKQLQS